METKNIVTIFIIVFLVLVMGFVFTNNSNSGVTGGAIVNVDKMVKVKLETNHGDIVIELRDDMPVTSGNFKSLVESGTYDKVIFHRVIDGFMIQGGDPTGTGFGDPSIPNIKDEFTDSNKNDRGTISMANAGPNTGSSQFFINLKDNNFLDGKHPAFGKVVEGMDVVDKIAKVSTGANDRPIEDVVIVKASII
jgi:peptidylprolyl isomerase